MLTAYVEKKRYNDQHGSDALWQLLHVVCMEFQFRGHRIPSRGTRHCPRCDGPEAQVRAANAESLKH